MSVRYAHSTAAAGFLEGSSVAGSHRGLRPRNRPPRRQHACNILAKRQILDHQQGVHNGSTKGLKSSPNGSQMEAKWVQNGFLEASWSVVASWRPLEALLDAFWCGLGGLEGRNKVLLNGSWPLQEGFQDRFQPSWGQKAPKREAKRLQNRAQKRLKLKMAKP